VREIAIEDEPKKSPQEKDVRDTATAIKHIRDAIRSLSNARKLISPGFNESTVHATITALRKLVRNLEES
jgi:hypothetical protein